MMRSDLTNMSVRIYSSRAGSGCPADPCYVGGMVWTNPVTGSGQPHRGIRIVNGLQTLRVTAGEVIAYRLFDIAFAIDLVRAEAIWNARPGAGSARKRLSVTSPKALAYDVPPLVLALDAVTIELPGGPVRAGVTARLYDFGVLTLALSFPANALSWTEFSELLNM